MNLKIFNKNRLMKFLILLMAFSSLLAAKTDDDLLEIVKEGFDEKANAGGLANKQEALLAFRKPFEGLSDAQKIRSLLLFLYDIDESDSKWSMSSQITMGTSSVIIDDPNFIEDWTTLRKMLRGEKSPRKFYLLSKLTPRTNTDEKHDFVSERMHMLFADGRVAKEEGEYTRDYAHDVSAYAYKAIIGNLKALGADFEPPAENLPHEEQAMILAKWLKENWPRCENLEIRSGLLSEESRPRKSLLEKPSSSQVKEREPEAHQETKSQNEGNRFPRIITGVLLVGILLLLLKIFKSKSTS